MRRRAAPVVVVGIGLLLGLVWWSGPDRGADAPPPDAAARSGVGRTGVGAEDPGEADVDAPSASARAPGTPDPAARAAAVEAEDELSDDDLAKLEEELLASPQTHVICDLGLEVRHGWAYLAIGEHSGFNGRRVQVVNGRAYLPLVYDLGQLGDAEFDERSGTFSLEGYGPQTIGWSDPGEDGRGRCTAPITPEPAGASLVGTLTLRPSGAPAAGAWVEGCGNMAFADERGVVYMDIVPEPCTILAMRQDGLLRTMSDPVSITPAPGEDVVVDIQIPEAPRGGLGVQLTQDDAGHIRIVGVLDTGPAGEAGLREGDLVVEVDGEPTEGMALEEFVKVVGGDAGTSVELKVERLGEPLTFDLVREVLTEG